MHFSLAVGPPLLVDRLFRRYFATDLMLVAAGTALISIAAQLSVPIGTVPLTGQTLAVMLVGAFLGWSRGALSVAFYLLLGGLGLPVFAGSGSGLDVLVGPSGGYLAGFLLAVIVIGWAVQSRAAKAPLPALGIFIIASVLVLIVGALWLIAGAGVDPTAALTGGVIPFLIGDTIKAIVATAILAISWRYHDELDRRATDQDFREARPSA